jgi:flagellar export protein FliJ
MNTFRFPLQKALDWRQSQLELAEARVEQQLAALASLDRARLELETAGNRTELQVRQFQPLAGGDLSALGSFRLALKARERDLATKRVECRNELAVRQADMLEARRRCRLLEKLKERRSAEWQAGRDRELEELATDSYLARWTGRRA